MLQGLDRVHVWRERIDRLLTLEDADQVAFGTEHLCRCGSKGCLYGRTIRAAVGQDLHARELHLYAIAAPAANELVASHGSVKAQLACIALGSFEQHERRAKGGVPAEVDLGYGRKPAQVVESRPAAHAEGCFGQTVLGCDGEHGGVG